MSTSRIVVTGIGASSPLGGTAAESWSALLNGESGTRTLEHDWVQEYALPVTFAAEAMVRPEEVLERPIAKSLDATPHPPLSPASPPLASRLVGDKYAAY